jgi:hypothetical protein
MAVASLVAMQPAAAAVQVASVWPFPAAPSVSPVVLATQPATAHCAVAVDCAIVAGASVTGFLASAAASFAALVASVAAFAAVVAAFFSFAVAPGAVAVFAAAAASCFACSAWSASWAAFVFCCSAIMSATTWPAPAEESACAWQPASPAQLAVVCDSPCGGPRAPLAPFTVFGPSLPAAEVPAVPWHPVTPAQSRKAEAIVQLDAPGTVGPPLLADEPGAVGAVGVVAGWSWPGPCWPSSPGAPPLPPVVPEVTVAFWVERICTSGAIRFASGPVEAPELVTAWQTPPITPVQVPSLCEPRGSAETAGSTAVAALVTAPWQTIPPEQVSAAPAAEAADGPVGIRATFTFCAAPACWPALPA